MIIDLSELSNYYYKLKKKVIKTGGSILILASYSIDSICGVKILSKLFIDEGLDFKIIPVGGISELESKLEDAKAIENLKYIIFVNCTARIELQNFWFFKDEYSNIKIIIFDSMRPYNHTIFSFNNSKRIIIIDDKINNFKNAPTDADFLENSDNNIDNISNDNDDGENLLINEEGNNIKKEIKIENKEANNKIIKIHNYYFGTYYGKSITSIIYELTLQLNKDSKKYLWLLMISEYSYFTLYKYSKDQYENSIKYLEKECVKYNYEQIDQRVMEYEDEGILKTVKLDTERMEVGTISKTIDINLKLLKYWSLYDSLFYSNNTLCSLKTWKENNLRTLHNLLMKISIPLIQAKEQYSHLNKNYKENLKEKLLEYRKEFSLNNIITVAFNFQMSPNTIFSNIDIFYCIQSVFMYNFSLTDEVNDLEIVNKDEFEVYNIKEKINKIDEYKKENFWAIYNNILENDIDYINKGIDKSIKYTKDIYKEIFTIISKKVIKNGKHFRYTVLDKYIIIKQNLNNNYYLQEIGNLILKIYEESSTKETNKPLLLCIEDEFTMRYKVFGIISSKSNFKDNEGAAFKKNVFSNIFKNVIEENNIRYNDDNFEGNIVEIHKEDFDMFLENMLEFEF